MREKLLLEDGGDFGLLEQLVERNLKQDNVALSRSHEDGGSLV